MDAGWVLMPWGTGGGFRGNRCSALPNKQALVAALTTGLRPFDIPCQVRTPASWPFVQARSLKVLVLPSASKLRAAATLPAIYGSCDLWRSAG